MTKLAKKHIYVLIRYCVDFDMKKYFLLDTVRKLIIQKTFGRRPELLLKSFYTFNLCLGYKRLLLFLTKLKKLLKKGFLKELSKITDAVKLK